MKGLSFMVALALAACTQPAPERQPFETQAGAAALQAWRESGLPDPNTGRCNIGLFRVVQADEQTFKNRCNALPEKAYGCSYFATTDGWFIYDSYPVIVVSPIWHSEPSIIVHELMHSMTSCTKIWGVGDPWHSNPKVWTAAGGETSVQSRAMAILAQ